MLTVDGVYKLLFSINGEFPGPPIIVYEGQTVSIYLSIKYFFLNVVHLITHKSTTARLRGMIICLHGLVYLRTDDIRKQIQKFNPKMYFLMSICMKYCVLAR